MRPARGVGRLIGLLGVMGTGGPLVEAVVPPGRSAVAAREFRHPRLVVDQALRRVEALSADVRGPLRDALAELGVSSPGAYVDQRTGRFATLMPDHPLLPGTGLHNGLDWPAGSLPPVTARAWEEAAWTPLLAYVRAHGGALGVDASELADPGTVTVHERGALIQVVAPRVASGLPVRDAYLTAVINHGNLVLLGAHNWGTLDLDPRPSVADDRATQALETFLQPLEPEGYRRAPGLAIVPMASGALASLVPLGQGLTHRLVWVLSPRFPTDVGVWEALVDAHTGELLAFVDTAQYQSARRVQGGVYPVTNDQVPPEGVEQPGWPMPFADMTTSNGTFFADTGGNLPVCATGSVSSSLSGRYVRMIDSCGAIGLASAGDLDFGTSAGTDCTTPGIGGPGNTHASRTGFHELNKIMEQARGYLPGNAWLQQPLTANMNVPNTCGGSWSGSALALYRSGVPCNNPGEIASVFDHEWGHGMDDNDANPVISNPGEAIADVYVALRLKESCVGRNFLVAGNCGGYGNPCLSCSGVRDLDWDRRALHQPTTVSWIDANCGSGSGPCGGIVHCEGAVYAEAVWDLFNRDLPALMGMSADTALEVATRATYLGAGVVGTAFTCTQGAGGCGASGAYLNFLAADDDDGSLANGTPHMGAFFAAFDRHGIACPTPAVATSGCPNAPAVAPVVSGTAEDKGARLSWSAVPGAVKYRVYRTEGVFGCDFGKVLLGETQGTTWSDAGLQNGRPYSYTVAAVGLADTCLGPMSACTPVAPAPGINLTADLSAVSTEVTNGDGDAFIDNCESVVVRVPVTNTGTAPQTNVRVVAAQPLSHPGMAVTGFAGGVALAPCAGSGAPAFVFRAVDLAPDDSIRFRVDITSDELLPAVRSYELRLGPGTEGDHQFFASRTFGFETDDEGWQPFEGTFARTNAAPGGSGGPGTFYLQSSSFLNNRCDEVRSPLVSLTATSTLSLQDHFDIEPASGPGWRDRANLGRVAQATGERTLLAPDGGRTYNAFGGTFAACGMSGQSGWGGPNPSWAPSTWTAGALGSATVAGQPIRFSVRYGTDFATAGAGFRLDTVTVTDVNLVVPDAQPDQCVPANQPPVASPDNSNSGTLGPVSIPVLANDTEPDGQCMRVAAVTAPANGTAIVNSLGCPNVDTVTYIPTPACGLPCNDSFQYTVSDQNGGTATATVTVNQVPVELQGFRVE